MSRSIIYGKAPHVDEEEPAKRGEPKPKDTSEYGDKLAKYIPAEVLAFFVPAVAVFTSNISLWAIFVIAAVFTPIYVWIISKREKEPQRWFTYIIAIAAFLVWAFGTTQVGTALFGFSSTATAFVLAVGVFVIPALDEGASHLFKK